MTGWGWVGHEADKAGDALGRDWSSLKKTVGTGVDEAAHDLGGYLDHVGLHDAAQWVEDKGDGLASSMGASVAECELGGSDDPTKLIHGDPAAIRKVAGHLGTFRSAFETAHKGMAGLSPQDWTGQGADAFREKFAAHPKQWLNAADACSGAGEALDRYADTVEWAQQQAQRAIEHYEAGRRDNQAAVDDYNERVRRYNDAADAYNATLRDGRDPGPPPVKPSQPGRPGDEAISLAKETLAAARGQRDEAAREARKAVDAGTRLAPRTPAFTERLRLDAIDLASPVHAEHVLGGAALSAGDMMDFLRGLSPTDPYNLTHPAEYQQHTTDTLAGLMLAANHPQTLAKALVGTGWTSDPDQAGGYFVTNLLGALAGDGGDAPAIAADRAAADAGDTAAGAARDQLAQDGPRTSARPQDAVTDCGDPVDVASGRMYLTQTDVALDGLLPLVFTRRTDSGYRAGRWFGPSWSSTADQRLEIDDEGVILVAQDGLLLSYPHPAVGVPTLPAEGPRLPLELGADGGYTLTDPDTGRRSYFTPYGETAALLTEVSDRNGLRICFDYTEDGTPTGILHDGGYRLRITTEDGRITALALAGRGGEPDTELLRYGYRDGCLTEVVNSCGTPLRFTYDAAGRVTSWTDRNGHGYTYEYDERGRCVRESGDAGHLRYAFDHGERDEATGERVTCVTDSLGHTTRYVINGALQVVARVDPLGAVERYAWDRYDRLLSYTDALGRTTALGYDVNGRPTTVTRPDGRVRSTEYTAEGLPRTVTTEDGSVWRREYDERGNVVATVDPRGATTRYSYDARGRLTAVTDALGHTTRVRCDAAGLPVEVTDALGTVTGCERDAFGRVVAVTDPLGAVTRSAWTVEGLLAARTAPDGATQRWTYDGEGNCLTHADAMGAVTRFEYTHFDQLAARIDPDGARHEFTHDTELRLRAVRNPLGLTWTYDYDAAGRLVAETDFDGRRTAYSHDPAGQLVRRVNALGQSVRYAYDELGRMTSKDADGRLTSFEYDVAGDLVRAVTDGVTLIQRRDRLGRVTSETCDGRTITFTHDALGRRVRRVTPSGAVSVWAHDAAGRRTRLTTSGRVVDFAYDEAGREVGWCVGELLAFGQTWDAGGRLTGQTVSRRERVLRSRAYTYRADGNLTAVEDSAEGHRAFDLDAAGRVTAVRAEGWVERYAYDAIGGQTTGEWPQGHPSNEATGERAYRGTLLTRAGRTRYEYDAQGRMVLRQRTRLSRKPETWRYEWDAEDRLVALTTPDGQVWRYVYDPLGRRIAKERVAPDGVAVLERTAFTWDGATLAEETTEGGALPRPVSLTWDHDGLRPLTQTERAGLPQEETDSRFFAIVSDLVGTPTELLSEDGESAWRTRATLWGTTAWASGNTAYTPLRFPGQYYDPESGLHYNVFRYYDPETARYTTQDPLGLAPAPNPATYVPNPHAWVDPLGLAPCPEVDPRKLDYLFNKDIKPDPHNSPRALQNKMQLRRIGINDTPASRQYVSEQLQAAVGNGWASTFTNEWGTYGVTKSVLYGPIGGLSVESTWQIMPERGARLSTVIFRGG
ncbi:putative T7SS-secreted protein [Streptomyces sp. ICBB 8177]|uniref:putative T7SS-secreted protein n=1 Tax=Streptomyces sp. ICBB 8177 TaxID=563922 RepID=UPI000D682D8A|nr:DUF6531 domain-containing protein [Streptomyces sp. ICBB 8177]PWI43381.1 type IV secretion protein Rhs [Streptomyces sp. ICBB 8177]